MSGILLLCLEKIVATLFLVYFHIENVGTKSSFYSMIIIYGKLKGRSICFFALLIVLHLINLSVYVHANFE